MAQFYLVGICSKKKFFARLTIETLEPLTYALHLLYYTTSNITKIFLYFNPRISLNSKMMRVRKSLSNCALKISDATL